jgi:hypothetical protein
MGAGFEVLTAVKISMFISWAEKMCEHIIKYGEMTESFMLSAETY